MGGIVLSNQIPSGPLYEKNICKLYPLFLPFTRFAIGDDRSIKFWKDTWWGDLSFSSLHPKLFHLASQKEAVVADILSTSPHGLSWNIQFSRELYDWEAQTLTSLLDSLKDVFFVKFGQG